MTNNLKEKLISAFWTSEELVQNPNSINQLRAAAIQTFEKNGFPSSNDEHWKYTSLKSLLKPNYNLLPKFETALEYAQVKSYFIHDIESYKIVFIDGKYSSYLSETSHQGMDICLLSAALNKEKYAPIIKKHYNKIITKNSLTDLNTAFAQEGAYIHIPRNTVVDKPIQIIHFATGNEAAQMLQPRNLIVLEENAQVQIIERHQNLTGNEVWTNSVTEIFGDTNCELDYYKIQNDKLNASLIDHTEVFQNSNSNCSIQTFSFGGKLTRNNLNFIQNGEHIHSSLKGVTIIGEKQHVDHSTLVHHKTPNCTSHQDYKGIFDGKSVGVFNGKVLVEKEAQKTNAFQANNNILLTDRATINTKPQLEIFADDVRCSHGCTIGQLDESALFYLRSRGIPENNAKALLLYAFSNNVLESVKIPKLQQRINKLIAQKLNVDIGFNL